MTSSAMPIPNHNWQCGQHWRSDGLPVRIGGRPRPGQGWVRTVSENGFTGEPPEEPDTQNVAGVAVDP
jgi:hypothetical protein